MAAALALAACARYEPMPLPKMASLAEHASELHGVSPGARISLAALDRLVVINNPDLRAARAKFGIGEAQVLQAGLLPNPQITGSYPFLISGPGTTNAYSAGISQDLKSLLLRKTKTEVADGAAAQVNATVLWQEWQTIGKARLLYVDIVYGERTRKLLVQSREFLQERYRLTTTAVAQGNATLVTLSPDLVAVGDIQKSYDDLERLQMSRRHQLNALLGLAPDAPLPLAANVNAPQFDDAVVRRGLTTLADRRPDLIALQYGFRSQDAKLRQAILSQFPNLSVGVIGGSDTSDVISFGPQVTIELPIFDRNQGGIALERATREQLQREFEARISTAAGDVRALLSEQRLLLRQLARVGPRLREARAIAAKTAVAFKAGAFDERAYIDIAVARLAREQEQVALQQASFEGQVALATLIGAGFAPTVIDPEPAPADPLGIFGQGLQ